MRELAVSPVQKAEYVQVPLVMRSGAVRQDRMDFLQRALAETLQFAGSHLLTSLLAFNVGVEIGQILVLAALVPALQILFRFAVAERVGVIVLSALAAHTAWHWMSERWEALRQFPAPALDASVVAMGVRVLLGIVALLAVAWFTRRSRRRLAAPAVVAPDRPERPGSHLSSKIG